MMIYVVLAILVGILVWRIILPNMRLEPTVGGAATTIPTTAPPSGGWFAGYSKSKIPSILLVIAGMIVFFVGGLQHPDGNNPDPATIGSWGRNHWFSLLILWGIVASLIRLNACGATAKTLQTVSAGVVVAVLVAFPLWGLATSPAAPAHATTGSQQETMTLTMPANGDSARVNTRPGYAISYDGSGFSVHCIYRDGSEGIVGDEENPCRNGPMQYQYVRDTTGKTNTVTYGFVRP